MFLGILLLLACLLLTFPAHAALVFEPAAPWMASGGEIQLSVSGAQEPVTWTPNQGFIDDQTQGIGFTVTYTAPPGVDTALDFIAVRDGAGNTGTISVLIQPAAKIAAAISPENAQWRVYTNRSLVRILLPSADGRTLWAGTNGGLEKRNAYTGEVVRVFTTQDGLPDNNIWCLLDDGSGGLWVGSGEREDGSGLARLHADGGWTRYDTTNSGLPTDYVLSLLDDGVDGLWVGTSGGLVRLSADGEWTEYDIGASGLQSVTITSLASDGKGGVWIGTTDGLAHLSADGTWEEDEYHADLPDSWVSNLLSDGSGGLWIGTRYGGLARLDADDAWHVYRTTNSKLPDKDVRSLHSDGTGGVWIGTGGGGLAHLGADSEWKVYNNANSDLPDNHVLSLHADGSGELWVGTHSSGLLRLRGETWTRYQDTGVPDGSIISLYNDCAGTLWVGTEESGVARLGSDGFWTLYDRTNAGLPDNRITSLLGDRAGGLWAGTDRGGLAHLDADGTWMVYDSTNSDLPDNRVRSLHGDATGGLWVGTERGLARLGADGAWLVYRSADSELPFDTIGSLGGDGTGGLWLGNGDEYAVGEALARLAADGTWTVYHTGIRGYDAQGEWTVIEPANSDLPDTTIRSLHDDHSGTLWIGTQGLTRLAADGTWAVYRINNSDLPSNLVNSVLSDGENGVWTGTGQGLARLSADGEWTVYNSSNSGLPDSFVNTLHPDGTGGLWIGTEDGLAHLGFGRKNVLTRQTDNLDLATQKSAALVILAPGRGYNDSVSLEFMATHAYRSLQSRGFDHDEIYFLSYKPDLDINGDGITDRNAVDAPLTFDEFRAGASRRNLSVEDVRAAFAWAEAMGKLDQPLLVVYFGHGDPDELLLDAANTTLGGQELKDLLDSYEQATGSQAVVILEACHSGTLLPTLSKPGRLLLSSADDNRAYFDKFGQLSFSRLLFDRLRQKPKGDSFGAAYRHVKNTLSDWGTPFDGSATNNPAQNPQLDDAGSLAESLCLNVCFEYLSDDGIKLELESSTLPQNVTPGQSLNLQVRIRGGMPHNPHAIVMTPQAAVLRDSQGFPLVPAGVVDLTQSVDDPQIWQGTFNGFDYQGGYTVNFQATSPEGVVSAAPPVKLSVTEGPVVMPAPVPNLDTLENGRHLRVDLPATGEGQDTYLGIGLPDGSFYLLQDENQLMPFDGLSLSSWQGGDTVLDLPVAEWMPRGQYQLYLLRVPAGVEPLANPAVWELGRSGFTVE